MEFNQDHLEDILVCLAAKLAKTTIIYIFGGAVMVYRKMKPATKDIDILFEKDSDYHDFIAAAKECGFVTTSIPSDYKLFFLSAMLQNHHTYGRLDLFLRKVCGKFEFNDQVKKRAVLFKEIGKLQIYFIALEDIVLMKALTDRDRDLDDIKVILGALDFKKAIDALEHQKIEYQREILERLLDFEEKQGLRLSIPSTLRKWVAEENEKEWQSLLLKQVKTMLHDGKSKEEIMKYFELNKIEWKELIEK